MGCLISCFYNEHEHEHEYEYEHEHENENEKRIIFKQNSFINYYSADEDNMIWDPELVYYIKTYD